MPTGAVVDLVPCIPGNPSLEGRYYKDVGKA